MTRGLLAFFDIDNTLIQSSSGHVAALLGAIREVYGLGVSINVINHHGMTDPEIITRILAEYEVNLADIEIGLQDCLDCMPLKYAAIVESEKIVMMEGVLNLLTQLEQNGIILGLVTGNLEKIARAKLKKIGIDHFFKIGGSVPTISIGPTWSRSPPNGPSSNLISAAIDRFSILVMPRRI